MVKKKIKKNVGKTKSLNFNIPESFSALSFQNKIISIVLITLVIGVIGSLFPGNVTGMATTGFQNVFAPLKGVLSAVNDLIISAFGVFFPNEEPVLIYARVILFALIIGIIYFIMSAIGSENPFVNILVGAAIAYLSTFFIPVGAIAATGILYSSTFISIMLIIPLILLWIAILHIRRSKFGYLIKVILLLIMISVTIGANDKFGVGTLSNIITGLLTIALIVMIIFVVYWFYKFLNFKHGTPMVTKEEAEAEAAKYIPSAFYELMRKAFGKAKT